MGGAGFGQGLTQGLQQAQDRQLQMQQLKLQQNLAKFQQKHMETQDQMQQLQLHSLQRKIEAEARLPGMQQDLLASPPPQQEDPSITTLKNLLGDRPNEPFQPSSPTPVAPDIDRHKLATFLQAASDAGQDPDRLMQLMGLEDPRMEAIRQSMQPDEFVKLGEGEELVSKKTGTVKAQGKPKTERPISVAPGGTLVDPKTGQPTFTAPAAPPKPPDYGDRLESLAAAYSMNKFGKPMTFSEMLATDPIEAKKLRDQAMVEEPATIAAGKIAATIPERKAEMLTPSEANELGVPFGTTKGEAAGVMPITAQQRAALASYDSARVIIRDIRQYSEKVNQAAGGLKGKAQQSMKLWGAWTQSDPDSAMLQSKAGELANLARSMGEKGALADKDVARAAALVPGVMDSREVAQQKLTDMMKLIDEGEANFRKSLGINAQAPGPTGKATPKATAPATDPLSSIPVPKGLTAQQEQIWRKNYAEEKAKTQLKMKPKAKK